MASVNKVILMGNLGRDPEVKYMPNGDAVANFSIATMERWKDKSGNKQEKTEWHNIVMYRKLAELAGEYLAKGRPVYIEGRLQTRKWEKDGITRYSTEIVADSMQFLGSGNGGSSNDDGDGGQGQHDHKQQSQGDRQQAGHNTNKGFDDFEDDIPFN